MLSSELSELIYSHCKLILDCMDDYGSFKMSYYDC